jgi:hypothetical protein
MLRIYPIVAYDPVSAIIEPEQSLFPKNANKFYDLRQPRSDKQRRTLSYLAEFYDIHFGAIDASSSESDDIMVSRMP